MKRFYTDAEVAGCVAGYTVELDAKLVRTPLRAALVVPNRALAEAVAAEWRAQTGEIKLDEMPLTRLAATALDRVAGRRESIIDEVVRHAGTDLVCYRAESPPELVERQRAVWQPLVEWAVRRFDAPLTVTDGVVPIEQPAAVLGALRAAVSGFTDFELTALHVAAAAAGSLVIALALAAREVDAAAATAASQLDERYQAERWGEDRDAAARRGALADDIGLATWFLGLVRG